MKTHFTLLVALLGMTPCLSAEPLPDFHLQDVNPQSTRYLKEVSPRDYRQTISLFYFGAST